MSNYLHQLPQIAELTLKDADTAKLVLSDSSPVVLRGLANNWPVVENAKKSTAELVNYLLQFDSGKKLEALFAQPDKNGRLFYGSSLQNFNFERMQGYLKDAFSILRAFEDQPNSPAFYIGSASVAEYLPGLEQQCKLDFLADVIPNIWIGNRTRVATHNDNSENIACVAAGRRRFTLFPPDQEKNLYIAASDITPGGRPISLVDINAPDYKNFPNFEKALMSAQSVILNAGDALYIPTNWWHSVDALDAFNILINFWWKKS